MDTDRIFKRKIYDSLLKWKETSNGKSALLVQGARRIGKSTIVEEFAKREYDSYILIDFTKCSQEVLDLFNDVSDLNYIFLRLQLIYHVQLKERKSPPVLLIKVFSYHDKSKISVTYNHMVEEIAYCVFNMVVQKRNMRLKERLTQISLNDYLLHYPSPSFRKRLRWI